MRRYITFKAGQSWERVRNSGQFTVPEDLVIFPGQAVKIPAKQNNHVLLKKLRNLPKYIPVVRFFIDLLVFVRKI